MERRSIPLTMLESVLENPQQVLPERGGKKAYQSQLDFGGGKIFLLRAIVDETVDPPWSSRFTGPARSVNTGGQYESNL